MTKTQRMTAALEEVELWLHDAALGTAAGELLNVVRAALGRKESTDDSMKNTCRHCGDYHAGRCAKNAQAV